MKIALSVKSVLDTCVWERHYPRYGSHTQENTSCSSKFKTDKWQFRMLSILRIFTILADKLSFRQIALKAFFKPGPSCQSAPPKWASHHKLAPDIKCQKVLQSANALLVKAHWEWSIGISELCLSFYLCPNISDRFFSLAPHFIRIQLFQIYF